MHLLISLELIRKVSKQGEYPNTSDLLAVGVQLTSSHLYTVDHICCYALMEVVFS